MDSNEVTDRSEIARCRIKLTWYEEEITKRGRSLAAIFAELRADPQKPWRCGWPSYEQYCQDVWHMSPRRLQQIAAGESVKALLSAEAPDLAPLVETMREGTARELVTTPPERRVEVLRAAIAANPHRVTGKGIKRARAVVIDGATGEPEPAPKKLCPHCGKEL